MLNTGWPLGLYDPDAIDRLGAASGDNGPLPGLFRGLVAENGQLVTATVTVNILRTASDALSDALSGCCLLWV